MLCGFISRAGLISLSVGTVVSYSMGPYQGKGSGETSSVLGSDTN